jgi:YHS domain-containing protein
MTTLVKAFLQTTCLSQLFNSCITPNFAHLQSPAMKQLAILCFALLAFTACKEQTAETPEHKMPETEASAPVSNKAAILAGKMDPVCEMEADTSWTEYQVHEGDTVRFCSETCKKAFTANPAKYLK